MPIRVLGDRDVTDVRLGDIPLQAIAHGDRLVWIRNRGMRDDFNRPDMELQTDGWQIDDHTGIVGQIIGGTLCYPAVVVGQTARCGLPEGLAMRTLVYTRERFIGRHRSTAAGDWIIALQNVLDIWAAGNPAPRPDNWLSIYYLLADWQQSAPLITLWNAGQDAPPGHAEWISVLSRIVAAAGGPGVQPPAPPGTVGVNAAAGDDGYLEVQVANPGPGGGGWLGEQPLLGHLCTDVLARYPNTVPGGLIPVQARLTGIGIRLESSRVSIIKRGRAAITGWADDVVLRDCGTFDAGARCRMRFEGLRYSMWVNGEHRGTVDDSATSNPYPIGPDYRSMSVLFTAFKELVGPRRFSPSLSYIEMG